MERKAMTTPITKIREAIEFYADHANWDDEVGYKPRLEDRAIGADRGKRARDCLQLLSDLEKERDAIDLTDKVLGMTDEQIRAVLLLEKRCPNCTANETKATIIQALYDHVKERKT